MSKTFLKHLSRMDVYEWAGIVIHNVKSFFASCQFFSIQVKLPVISLAETKFMEEDSRDYCLPVAVGV